MFPILSQSLCFSGSACPNLGKKPISSQFQILLLRDDVSLSSLCTSGKMRGEKNKRWTSTRATLSSVWEKIAGLVTLHGNKEGLRKYSTSRRLSCQKISHLQVTGP